MANYVQSNQVLLEDAIYLGAPFTPQGIANKLISTVTTEIIGPYWLTPYVQNGVPIYPAMQPAYQTSVKPTPASVKALRLKSTETGIEMYIAILDTDCVTSNTYATYANDTTGTLPTMPTVTVPGPLVQYAPVSSTATSNTFYFPLPDNPNTLYYQCTSPWINGATPEAFPTTANTPANLVTALNSTYGTTHNATFSLVTTAVPGSPATNYYSIKVVSTVSGAGVQILMLGMQVALTPVTYTCTVPSYLSAVAADGCIVNGIDAPFVTGGIVIGDHNRSDLVNSLTPLFEKAASFALVSTNQVSVNTVLKPTYVTIAGADTSIVFS